MFQTDAADLSAEWDTMTGDTTEQTTPPEPRPRRRGRWAAALVAVAAAVCLSCGLGGWWLLRHMSIDFARRASGLPLPEYRP